MKIDSVVQSCFDAISQGRPVVLVHDQADGSQVAAVVQAVNAPLNSARFQGWSAYLVASQGACQYFLSAGLSLDCEQTIMVDHGLTEILKKFAVGTLSASVNAADNLPVKSVPNGGGQSRYNLNSCAYDLVRWAGSGAIALVMQPMKGSSTLENTSDILKLTTKQLMNYAVHQKDLVKRVSESYVPIGSNGVEAQVVVYRSVDESTEHLALVFGDPAVLTTPCSVRLHSECLTGDVFGSLRCDCGWQLQHAIDTFQQQSGVILYLRQEGRGIGLGHKIKAYDLQTKGYDTVEANHHLGFGADERSYGMAVQMLRDLGVNHIKLFTNNPRKVTQLTEGGICVDVRENIQSREVGLHQRDYLYAKKSKLGHLLELSAIFPEDQ